MYEHINYLTVSLAQVIIVGWIKLLTEPIWTQYNTKAKLK